MSASPAWDIVAQTLVRIALRIVLTQRAEEIEADADDCVHPSIDRGTDRALPRGPSEAMPVPRPESEPGRGHVPE